MHEKPFKYYYRMTGYRSMAMSPMDAAPVYSLPEIFSFAAVGHSSEGETRSRFFKCLKICNNKAIDFSKGIENK